MADRSVILMLNRKSHPARRSVYLGADTPVFILTRSKIGQTILLERNRGAKLDGHRVRDVAAGLRGLDWNVEAI